MKNTYPILVVEDDPVTRRLLEKILAEAGCSEVRAAVNGRDALEILKHSFYPIVITDWIMPEMDGLQLCHAIRHDDLPGYIYIIVLTVKDAKSDIVRGLEAGADEYLVKPINPSELLVRLKTAQRILGLEKSLKTTNEEIRTLSIKDPLTGIFNRIYLMERLPQEIKRSHRYGHPLSIIMCDIDHFKEVNDEFGHKAGDQILKEFVHCLSASVRQDIDWIARYGGEEFLIVLPETDLQPACLVAERLRRVVSEKVFRLKGKDIQITSSFGVSNFNPAKGQRITFDVLMEEADEFLYEAKRAGRNRVKGQNVKDKSFEMKGESYAEEEITSRR
jgi:diguanylate cyclase (GGDEF)-like protein